MTLFKTIYNITTDETINENLSVKEIAEIEAAQAEVEVKAAQTEAKAAARQAVLDKLGLTAEDIAALGL